MVICCFAACCCVLVWSGVIRRVAALVQVGSCARACARALARALLCARALVRGVCCGVSWRVLGCFGGVLCGLLRCVALCCGVLSVLGFVVCCG